MVERGVLNPHPQKSQSGWQGVSPKDLDSGGVEVGIQCVPSLLSVKPAECVSGPENQ